MRLVKDRERLHRRGPDITTVRRCIKGHTFKRSQVETRGRKRILSERNLATMNQVRRDLLAKADGEHEVTWEQIIRKSRVPKVDASTVAKHMKKRFGVQARSPRLKPSRSSIDKASRKRLCNRLRKLPPTYWTQSVHLVMDNKTWPFPRSVKGAKYLKQIRVRHHLRTRSEGLNEGFTKPDKTKHRSSFSGIKLCAGIIKGRVRVWHYLDGSWTGKAAADLYEQIIGPALVKHHGRKRRYNILEDNDPTGYKSTEARAAKRALNIFPIEFPTYSPDLNPCDFSLWEAVANRMAKQKAPKNESLEGFKSRLRRTALAIPTGVINKMLAEIAERAQSIYDRDGGNIPRD